MEELLKKIQIIQEQIFNEWNPNLMEGVVFTLEYIVSNLSLWEVETQNIAVEIMNYIESAIINKDNLVLADILEYELKPLIVEI